MNITQYIEQHKNIRNEISILRELLNKNSMDDAANMALHINTLAGIIKVHLQSEDKYLYPTLQQSTDEKIRLLAKAYQDEMGTLAEHYTGFKELYNTKSKIINNQKNFPRDMEDTLNKIEKRIDKEEIELYRLVRD
ncbi:hemerythrin domain-containing protein [Tissierella sp. Yu-01]|uniref:hemerythrin domain-containing protein n=1 Tax=Tissierella sp. Yu-01 TaxID=3035694 RepID=UPI00240DEAEF|nr:hemerythrin domain-containing protein [Tissierella sp. Yu-01]WFA08003.1 hemerythrin domain-containing protein [Tissierella sp. Yu-01]